jgi:hypothetical protein
MRMDEWLEKGKEGRGAHSCIQLPIRMKARSRISSSGNQSIVSS